MSGRAFPVCTPEHPPHSHTARCLVHAIIYKKIPSENPAGARLLCLDAGTTSLEFPSAYRLGQVVPGALGDLGALAFRQLPAGRGPGRGCPALL